MKLTDINKRFTEIVTEYLTNGYMLNIASMGGSQGERAKVDLTDGTTVVRVYIDDFSERGDLYLSGLEIVVGKTTQELNPRNSVMRETVWSHYLTVVYSERFYELGIGRNNERYYGRLGEATTAARQAGKRFAARCAERPMELTSDGAIEIAKRVIRKKLGVKRVADKDVSVTKEDGNYIVRYRKKHFRLA